MTVKMQQVLFLMKDIKGLIFCAILAFIGLGLAFTTSATNLPDPFEGAHMLKPDTIPPLKDRIGNYLQSNVKNPFDLNDPKNVNKKIEYDPVTGKYIISETIGEDYFRAPSYMTFQEYLDYRAKEQQESYFNSLAGIGGNSRISKTDPMGEYEINTSLVERLFGGKGVDIRPQGNVDITFGGDYQKIDNPEWPRRQQVSGGFDFDMGIRINIEGKVGEKLNLSTNYNNKATFDFDNIIKIQYDALKFNEDEILRNIEAGNVSLPLRSELIQGSQSLLGIKTELQFGYLKLTALASQQKSERKDIEIQGGTQLQEFEVRADEYDENRHFFVSHYNRAVFEGALTNMPQINNKFRIKKIEVWITDIRNETIGIRDVVAMADIGEKDSLTVDNKALWFKSGSVNPDLRQKNELPANDANKLFEDIEDDPNARRLTSSVSTLESKYDLEAGKDFERKRARLMNPSEYFVQEELGFISLNRGLDPDEVVGIAYEYDYNGKTYKVGELTDDRPLQGDSLSVLFIKMLKSSIQSNELPTWDLMMKNIYSIGAYSVNDEDFRLNIFYEDPGEGQKRFLPEAQYMDNPLLKMFNLDNLNVYRDPVADGNFDFVPGLTIFPNNGRIMFPVLEPFGTSLKKELDPQHYAKYLYEELYDFPITRAREYPELNRFTIKGTYRSSVTSDISLGAFNIPEGSVVVRAGGRILQENVDYTIDYNIGRLKIINDSYLASGVPIKVSFEDNQLFSFQTKTMIGLRADYELSKKANIGATYMHLYERPYTEKVNIGDDPINNRIIGIDFNYSDEVPWLTRALDRLPLYSTKEKSEFTFAAEAAMLKPGHAKAINQGEDKEGQVLVDDFEGSATGIDLKTPTNQWALASIPQNDSKNNNPLFKESELSNDLRTGANRALLNWYRIDRSTNVEKDRNDPYITSVDFRELFPNRSITTLFTDIQTFDLSYYPNKRGQYNYEVPNGYNGYTAGLNSDGSLAEPSSRWAGIMRSLYTNDFEAANIEYIEFWMLNPFEVTDARPEEKSGGYLYFNLGNVSEDISKDEFTFFENGLPIDSNGARIEYTNLAKVPLDPPLIDGFDNERESREKQDLGFDGMNDDEEKVFFGDFINEHLGKVPNDDPIFKDPSSDNFISFRDDAEFTDNDNLLNRYERFNGQQGNSPLTESNSQYANGFTTYPDAEDLNRDRSSDQNESYYQYKIPIFPDVNNELEWNEFVTDSVHITSGTWYRMKVPISQYDKKVGSINDFRSIKFMRMFLTEFDQPITFRFATLDLVRNTWRRYSRDNLDDSRIVIPSDDEDEVVFDLNAVNIEEHSNRKPYPYALPPGIQRERAYNSYYANAVQNEQSLALEVCNLPDGRSKAIYKILNLDLRNYENLKMFIHMEESEQSPIPVEDGDLRLFVRLGSDFTQNFYEYELPLVNSPDISSGNIREVVWPSANNLDLDFELLRDLKILRNGDPNGSLSELYSADHPTNGTLSVKGNPSLGYVKNIMVGIRNHDDSKGAICAEVWINELRVGGLNEEGGVAALARADIKLADLGNVALAGNYSSIGWGALDEKLAQRSIEEIYNYDVSSNLQLGRFFPKNWGINLPFYGFYGSEVRLPKYDPIDLDIELDEAIRNAQDPEAIRERAIDYTAEKGISFTDVKKERTGGNDKKPMPWDISNFSVSYNYKEIEHHDPILQLDNTQKHTGGLDYTYNRGTQYIEPFKNKIKDGKLLKPIKDMNFNPLPNSFSFSTYLDKHYNQKIYRFEGTEWADRRFTWDRDYSLRWNFTKALKFDFDANTETLIDELDNFGNTIWGNEYTGTRNDYLVENFKTYGRKKKYFHRANLGYTLPTRSIPALDWMTLRGQVKADFTWNAASINVDSLGHVLQNGQDRSVNADLDFVRLYNKSKYLSSINKYGQNNANRNSGRRPTNPRDRGSKDADSKDAGKDQDQAVAGNNEKADRKKKGKKDGPGVAAVAFIRPLMSLRKVRFSYTERHRSIVPGFTETPQMLGLSQNFLSPGWQYVSGFMPDAQWLDYRANDKDWFTESLYFNEEVFIDTMQNYTLDVTFEPYNDFTIEANIKKTHNRSYTEIFANDDPNSLNFEDRENFNFAHQNRREFGTYSITYFSANTMFFEGKSELYKLFQRYEENRKIISERLAIDPNVVHTVDGDEYRHGFGKLQKDVLIPAFISAYTDEDPLVSETNFLKLMPLPNWKVRYNGLSKIAALSDFINSFELSHGYESTFTVNSYGTNIDYNVDPGQDPRNDQNLDNNVNYNSRYEMEGLVIDERFRPLIGLNMKTSNDISLNFEINKARNLRMDFANNWLNEMKSSEYVFGFSYLLEDVYLPLPGVEKKSKKSRKDKAPAANKNTRGNSPGARGSSNTQGNDMQINLDFSIRDDITLTHVLDQGIESKATNGRKSIRVSPSIDYQVNDYVGLRMFVDYDRTIPYTSLNYNTTRIDGGLTVTVTFK